LSARGHLVADRVWAGAPRLQRLRNADCHVGRSTCSGACADTTPCRMFLCGRCRSQVVVCRRCDRGQIYCAGTCAREARHEAQRAARRRHQATPRGRAMHAERNRRYRARRRCVTDHGPPADAEAVPLCQSAGDIATNVPLSAPTRVPEPPACHYCGHSPSLFVRLSPLPPRSSRRQLGGPSRGNRRPP
jgi:hypothetical protein